MNKIELKKLIENLEEECRNPWDIEGFLLNYRNKILEEKDMEYMRKLKEAMLEYFFNKEELSIPDHIKAYIDITREKTKEHGWSLVSRWEMNCIYPDNSETNKYFKTEDDLMSAYHYILKKEHKELENACAAVDIFTNNVGLILCTAESQRER